MRDHNDGHAVTALEYEVFRELAVAEGQAVIDDAMKRFGILDAAAVHREGRLEVGGCAVWVGVTASHRAEAFAACRYIIDEIKHRLPVWKKEHYIGLDPQWVNCQHHHHANGPHDQDNHKTRPSITARDYYARQTRLPEIGVTGQEKLAAAKILVAGVGGLGSAAAVALAGAGVGTVGLADNDALDASNLHRQLIYSAGDIGRKKAGLAAARLRALNPLVDVQVHQYRVTADNVAALFGDYDIVLDCTDNFPSKYLMNDAAILCGRPVVQASIYRFEGQLMTVDGADDAGCLRCLFPRPPAAGMIGDCADTGVLGNGSGAVRDIAGQRGDPPRAGTAALCRI